MADARSHAGGGGAAADDTVAGSGGTAANADSDGGCSRGQSGRASGGGEGKESSGNVPETASKPPQTIFYAGEQGTGPGQFNFPSAVALTAQRDKLLVSDNGNHRVQVFGIGGGDGGGGGSGGNDGTGSPTAPRFLYDFGMHVPRFALRGKRVFLTGKFARRTKAEAEKAAAAVGAVVDKVVVDSTQVMVAGAGAPDGQLTAARRNGLAVWSEEMLDEALANDEAEVEDERARREGEASKRGGLAPGELRFPGDDRAEYLRTITHVTPRSAGGPAGLSGGDDATTEVDALIEPEAQQPTAAAVTVADGGQGNESGPPAEPGDGGERLGEGLSVALSPDSSRLYIADATNHRVHALDRATLAHIVSAGGSAPAVGGSSGSGSASGSGGGGGGDGGKTSDSDGEGKAESPASSPTRGRGCRAKGSKNATALAAKGDTNFRSPAALAVSWDGSSVFVADWGNHRVVKLDAATLKPTGEGGGRGVHAGELQYPTDVVAMPPSGVMGAGSTASATVLVVDNGNHRLHKLVLRQGPRYRAMARFAGVQGRAAPRAGRDPQLLFPRAVALDAAGDRAFIADAQNNRVVIATGLSQWMSS